MRTVRLRPSFYRLSATGQLAFLESYVPRRGEFEELLSPALPSDLWSHPLLPQTSELCDSILIIQRLVHAGQLPADDVLWGEDGVGYSVGTELYGYGRGLILVQTRDVRVLKPRTASLQKLVYLVTDGVSLQVVPARSIHVACRHDPAPISPLMVVRKTLPHPWSQLLPANQLLAKQRGGTTVPPRC